MNTISYDDFLKVELRVGTIIKAEPFPEARKPAIKVWADFGGEIGVRQSSAQITDHYTADQLIGRQILGCINLSAKRIAGFESQFLLTGFADADGKIVLAVPDAPHQIPNGAKLL